MPGFGTVIAPAVLTCEELLAQAPRPIYLMGEGINYHRDELVGEDVVMLDKKYWQGQARWVHQCGWLRSETGQYAEGDKLMPIYMRRPEAVEKWEELHGKD